MREDNAVMAICNGTRSYSSHVGLHNQTSNSKPNSFRDWQLEKYATIELHYQQPFDLNRQICRR